MIQLSTIAPDFQSLVSQLQAAAANYPTWKDRITSSTGQTLTEMIAAVGAYSQFAIESSYQEVWPDSAKNAEALYAAATYAGIRIDRNNPAELTVNMTSEVSHTYPPGTQFVGAGTYWFNRDAVTIGPTPSPVTLYQGQVVNHTIYGLGTDFQAFVSQENNFTVSNVDVWLTVNSIAVPVNLNGLWNAVGIPGTQQFTLPDGSMILLFGNSSYGTKPGTNDVCSISYVVTLGQDGNNIPTNGKTISLSSDSTINGIATTSPSGGGNNTDPIVYKNVTPALFGAFDSAVTAAQYKKIPLLYPGVIDALVLSQREINPNALNWMNTMKVCLLTSTTWSTTDWQNFEKYFNAATMYSTRIFREDPQPVAINVNLILSCKNFSNLGQVQTNAQDAINNLFALRQGSIGLDVYISDVITAVKNSDSNIEFIQVLSPNVDIVLSSLNVNYPVLTEVLGGGTLPIGIYDYGISVTSTLGGSSAPAKWTSIKTTAANSAIQIVWPIAPNAASYSVWGRVTAGALGLITTTGSTSYTDNGSVTPSGTVPAQSTIASYYPKLISSNLTMAYTNRNIRS